MQIEGTTVSRASLCNLTEIERLGVGKECTLSVIKANKIIPKCIAVKDAVGAVEIPKECPVCHHPTRIFVSKNSGVKTLHCTNPDCTAKNVKKFSRFVSKSGMDIDGLSVQTMLKFINEGFIKQFPDIYHLPEHFDKISSMEGFGEKSCMNMQTAIEKSRHVHPVNLIFALCIPLIGTDAGKKIVNAIGFDGFADRMRNATDFVDIDGIGQEKSGSILEWYANSKNSAMFEALIKELDIEQVDIKDMSEGSLNGKTFVITGDVHDFANRSEFKAYVESQGGKVTGSVSKKTDYLVNNDTESTSSKNKKAKELGIPIISEDTFIEMFGHEKRGYKMPIKTQNDLPVKEILERENIFVMDENRASHQNIRQLEIAIVNLMPLKEDTELQILRSLSNTPIQVNVTFVTTSTHEATHTSLSHLNKFYETFDDIKDRYFDGMIITGAPVELMEYEEVDYWDEICSIMEWSKTHAFSTLHLCWGAQAGLYYHYGIPKRVLPKKKFGVYAHHVKNRKVPLVRGFDDVFYAPHSRHTEVLKEDILKHQELTILAESDDAGVFLLMDQDGKKIFVMGHPEYDRYTLHNEYERDKKKGLDIDMPVNYYPDNDDTQKPLLQWRSHGNILYSNWLNYYVYQEVPYEFINNREIIGK